MYKLVAIDIDGTLLNSKKQVSEENIRTISRAMENGVKVVICSGRIFKGGRIFARQICTRDPIIACNGAIIRDMEADEAIYDSPLAHEDCRRIIEVCQREDIYFHAYVGDVMYTQRMGYGTAYYMAMNAQLPEEDRVVISLVKDMAEASSGWSAGAYKFVVSSNDAAELLRVRSLVSQIDSVEIMSSAHDNFEVVRRGVNKGNALRILSEKLGISREETIAIGDNENDDSMIRFAGLGIAMGNATKPIKEIAGYVTLTNDQDGVAEAIKKFVLQA